jgi:hypothetical protein
LEEERSSRNAEFGGQNPLELVWELQNRRRLKELKSSPYSILNKEEILVPPISFDIWTLSGHECVVVGGGGVMLECWTVINGELLLFHFHFWMDHTYASIHVLVFV